MHPSPLTHAPDFSLPDQKGRIRTLDELLAGGRLLLTFHRGTW
jgi:peroxiredoxin